jgi:sugar lactone lactonase YvrE
MKTAKGPIMKPAIWMISWLLSASVPAGAATLKEIASFPDQQVTGVGASIKTGRVFVNFPFWSPSHEISVAEIKGGKPVAYPDGKWNAKDGDADERFVCVQSVVVDEKDFLWILDAGSPLQEGIIPGGPKLIKVALDKDQVERIYPIDEKAAPKNSYLNDVRIDHGTGHAFITESGIGSLIVVDLGSGEARRFLADHPSTKVETGKELIVDGIKPIDPKTNGTPQFHADGIALDRTANLLFFHALTAETLYSVPTNALIQKDASDESVAAKVRKVAKTPAPDGMLEGGDGSVLLAAFEDNAVIRFDPATAALTTIIKDDRLQWPDTLCRGPQNSIYVTTSQIHRMPKYNGGTNKRTEPFRLYQIK